MNHPIARRIMTIVVLGSAIVINLGESSAQTEKQQAVIGDLRKIDPAVKVRIDQRTSVPKSLSGKLSHRIDAEPKEIAMRFFQARKELFKMVDPEAQLTVVQVQDGRRGWKHLRIQQVYKSLPVEGKTMLMHINEKNEVRGVNGDFLPGVDLDTKARVRDAQAISAAVKSLNPKKKTGRTPRAELVIYEFKGKPYLAWKVRLFSEQPLGDFIYYINAKTGKVIDSYNNLKFALNRRTYDAGQESSLPGTLIRSEGQGASGDGDINAAYTNAGLVYNFYSNRYGRDSFDDAGAGIDSSVHYKRNFNNAFWTGAQFVYGDGDGTEFSPLAQSLDVVAHEYTHAVTENESNLVYRNQPGAINESLSDIVGSLVDAGDWMIGEDIYTPGTAGDALRYMDTPVRGSQPDHMDDIVRTRIDNGGVHINSGIQNKAAQLMADGGTHRCVAVNGMTRQDMGEVFYEAQRNWLTSSADFEDARGATLSAVQAVFPGDQAKLNTVRDAWWAVGVGVFARLNADTAGTIDKVAVASLGAGRVVTAMRDGSGDLRLIAWDIAADGASTRLGTATAGSVSEIAVSSLTNGRVVTAMRDGSGNLRLIAWDVSAAGAITRRGTATAGAISQVAVGSLTAGRVVTAMRDGGGNLRLIAWDIAADGAITRRGTAAAGAISRIAVDSLTSGRVATAMRDGGGNLRLIAWDIAADGAITRRGTATAGSISEIALDSLTAGRVVAAMRDGGGNLRLIAWDIAADGTFSRCGTATAGSISRIAAVSLDANRVTTTMRDGAGNLRLIQWDVMR